MGNNQQMFFFIFAPKFSGSTVMSQFLANAVDGYLPSTSNNEGQMIPGAKEIIFAQDRWDPNVDFNWSEIKEIWLSHLQQSQKNIFIEASPPNIMRLESIKRSFANEMAGMISISSPYMQISSEIKKKYHKLIGRKKLLQSDQIPAKLIQNAAAKWVHMAQAQRRNIESNPSIPFVTYEQFCSNPEEVIKAFHRETNIPTRESTTPKVQGKKETGITDIMDMTCKNLSFLSFKEIGRLTSILAPYEKLLHYFNYHLLGTRDIVQMYDDNMPLVIDGMHSRLHR